MANPCHPWDQQPDEDNESYARFLHYRNLGPTRSLRKAYQRYLQTEDGVTCRKERLHLPGTWVGDSTKHQWVSRATGWDIRNLVTYGGKVAVLHVLTISRMAAKNLKAVAEAKPGDDSWADIVQSVRLINEYLTPEVVRGIQERQQQQQPVREPVRAGDADPDE